jgi:hypothetical protein
MPHAFSFLSYIVHMKIASNIKMGVSMIEKSMSLLLPFKEFILQNIKNK